MMMMMIDEDLNFERFGIRFFGGFLDSSYYYLMNNEIN
jgi:hypothetical protein